MQVPLCLTRQVAQVLFSADHEGRPDEGLVSSYPSEQDFEVLALGCNMKDTTYKC